MVQIIKKYGLYIVAIVGGIGWLIYKKASKSGDDDSGPVLPPVIPLEEVDSEYIFQLVKAFAKALNTEPGWNWDYWWEDDSTARAVLMRVPKGFESEFAQRYTTYTGRTFSSDFQLVDGYTDFPKFYGL